MKDIFLIVLFAGLLIGCTENQKESENILKEYIEAANKHNIDKVYAMYSDSIVWYFGPFEFRGKDEAIKPLRFDKGANTKLEVSNIIVNGDTVDFNLLETSDVLTALGVKALHHFPRFIFREDLILRILSVQPPTEFQAYADSVSAFAKWLSENSTAMYNKFWPDGKFDFSEETGKTMAAEVWKWRKRIN